MGMQQDDQKIVEWLEREIKRKLEARTKYDEYEQLTTLNLSNLSLTSLPPELGLLSNLRVLFLDGNQLTQLPVELSHLSNLQGLSLYRNQLTHVPAELGLLSNLQVLHLHENQLTHVPAELGLLSNLQVLSLHKNQLTHVPAELGLLSNLQVLSLYRNQLTHVPVELGLLSSLQRLSLSRNRLTHVPIELGQLSSLQTLSLHENQLTHIPIELGQLSSLQTLSLHENQLTHVPMELSRLSNLQVLSLRRNQLTHVPMELSRLSNLQSLSLQENRLTQIPAELGQLSNLQVLFLDRNQLTQVPVKLGQLSNLQSLSLHENRLTQVPVELGRLSNLRVLLLHGNQLTHVPMELGKLSNLQSLSLQENPRLTIPPPEIITQGQQATLIFLRELQRRSVERYEAKLLLVGEGNTGKSSLLRSLCSKPFDTTLSTTHGIEVDTLTLPHPSRPNQTILLNTWDFGGQQIYHATHQFFLTRRSLYLVVWNARSGTEQGQLHYWLDTIQALAPDCPILLVATHTDECTPNLNYQLYKEAYPKLVGTASVSNKDGTGVEMLRVKLAQYAVTLPLVGQPWPTSWVKAEKALMLSKEHHISAEKYKRICAMRRIQAVLAQGTLGSYLHDLGKILYFRDDYELSNLVVLKSNWITKAISLVLKDPQVEKAHGILAHADLPRIWSVDENGEPYEPYLYPIFLRLMEKFDLSYQIERDMPGQRATHSLVPQLLPYQPPPDLPAWPQHPNHEQTHLQMVYRFDFVPAGIMSWFIVRTHRYTLDKHWREGTLLAYQQHYARVELNPLLREIRLVVWGIQPHNFFTILKDTLDLILSRFEGLRIRREVPCICHWETKAQNPCQEVYRYEEDLVRRMEARKQTIECPTSYLDVSVPQLLYGIHTSTTPQVMAVVEAGQQKIVEMLTTMQQRDMMHIQAALSLRQQIKHLCEWNVRHFTRQWNLEMSKIEAECPNMFTLLPNSRTVFHPKNWISRSYKLHLLCQHPSGPHRVDERYAYDLAQPREWWAKVSPWLKHLITLLKYGIPLAGAVGDVIDSADFKNFEAEINVLEKIAEDLPDLMENDPRDFEYKSAHDGQATTTIGPALRALYSFLKEQDKAQLWGGLQKVITPDGNILWLCERHARPYESPMLQFDK